MDRRSYLKYAGGAVAVGLLAGCSGSESGDGSDGASDGADGGSSGDGSDGGSDGGTTYGTLATSVTDQPSDIGDFESCIVTIDGMWLKPAGSEDGDEEDSEASGESSSATDPTTAETDTATETTTEGPTQTATKTAEPTETETTEPTESAEDDADATDTDAESNEESDDDSASSDNGRRYLEFDEPQEADLVKLQGSKTQLIEETEVETGEYLFLQLAVGGVEGTLTDGSDASVETPGKAPLKFNTKFEIRAEERTHFVADFTPVKRGNGSYLIRPVATGTKVLYGDESYEARSAESASETETETAASETAEAETESGAGDRGGNPNDNGNGGNGNN